MPRMSKERAAQLEAERNEARQVLDAQIPDAIRQRMEAVFHKMGLPDSPFIIEADPEHTGFIKVSLGDNEVTKSKPYFGSREVQEARVLGALYGIGLNSHVCQREPFFNWRDGGLRFASMDDLARCVESLASGQVMARNGKYAHIIMAGPRSGPQSEITR